MTIKYLDAKRIRGVKGEESSTMGTSGDVTEVGGVTLNSTYKVFGSNSIDLDGTDNAYLNMDGVLNAMSTTGTVSYWVRNGDGTAGYFLTFNRSDNSGGSSAITYMHSEHHTHLSKMDTTLNIGNSIQWQVRSPADSWSSSDRGWHHVVLTQDGTAVKFYFDGTEQTSFENTTDKSKWISDLTSRDNVRFGVKNVYAQGNVGEFTGQVDDIAIWDRAITAAEVTTLYGGGQASGTPVTALGISRTGLKAYWSCNSLDGTTLPNEAASIAEDKAPLVTAADTYTRQSYRMDSEEFATVSGGKLQFTLPTGDRGGFTSGYAGDTITYDIGVLSDTAWVARCKLTFTTMDHNDEYNSMNGVALWISDNATGNVETSGQDWASIVGFNDQDADGVDNVHIGGRIRDSSTPEISFNTATQPINGYANVNATTYFVQSTRDGNDLVTTIGTDSYGGTANGGTQTVTASNVTGLRYLKFTVFTEYRSAGDPNGSVIGNIDDFSIDDGVTTWATADKTIALAASTDLPENTLFDETDTKSTWWLQSAKWKGANQPLEISDLWSWWKAESQYMTLNSSGVTVWNPQTNTTPKKLIADSAGVEPTFEANGRNGRGIVKFDGTEVMHTYDDSYRLTQPLTFVIVMKFPTAVDDKTIFDADNTGNRLLHRNTGTAGTQLEMNNGAVFTSTATTAFAGNWGYEILVFNGSSSKWRINGVDVKPGTFNPSDDFNPITIASDYRALNGGSNNAVMDVMHFIIYDKALSDSEITDIEEWCASEVGT